MICRTDHKLVSKDHGPQRDIGCLQHVIAIAAFILYNKAIIVLRRLASRVQYTLHHTNTHVGTPSLAGRLTIWELRSIGDPAVQDSNQLQAARVHQEKSFKGPAC